MTRELKVPVEYADYSKRTVKSATIHITPFPACCGITILDTAAGACTPNFNPEDAVIAVKQKTIQAALEESECFKTGQMYALADWQELDKVAVVALGFKPIHSFKNPNTGNEITIYFKEPLPSAYEGDGADDYDENSCGCGDCIADRD